MYVHICMYVWRPENLQPEYCFSDAFYLFCDFFSFLFSFCENQSILKLSKQLAGQWAAGICLLMPSSDWDYQHVETNLRLFCFFVFFFKMGPGAHPSPIYFSFWTTLVYLSRCGHVHVSAGLWRSKKGAARTSDPLQLEWHVVVSCLLWVLGTELESFIRAVLASNRWAVSPAPTMHS